VPHTADLVKISKLTKDFNGAQLKAVVTEAGMIAIRKDDDIIIHDDFVEAVKYVMPKTDSAEQRMFC
jgi:ATP-dependent 26S proteasome regulatory subunit